MERFLFLASKKKNQYRDDADILANYHVSGVRISYELMVGLKLNLPRIRAQRSVSTMEGISWAKSLNPLPPVVFDGLADTEEEAKAMQNRDIMAREKAKVIAKYGRYSEVS